MTMSPSRQLSAGNFASRCRVSVLISAAKPGMPAWHSAMVWPEVFISTTV